MPNDHGSLAGLFAHNGDIVLFSGNNPVTKAQWFLKMHFDDDTTNRVAHAGVLGVKQTLFHPEWGTTVEQNFRRKHKGPVEEYEKKKAAYLKPRVRYEQPVIYHAVNSGFRKDDAHALLAGDGWLYRLTGSPETCTAAAAVGETWSSGPSGMGYSGRKAVRLAFRSSSWNSHAQTQAQHYHTHRNTVGGPPSTGRFSRAGKKKTMFCSMAAVACYQAVLSMRSGTCLALDASSTSPMRLLWYLNKSTYWTRITA